MLFIQQIFNTFQQTKQKTSDKKTAQTICQIEPLCAPEVLPEVVNVCAGFQVSFGCQVTSPEMERAMLVQEKQSIIYLTNPLGIPVLYG